MWVKEEEDRARVKGRWMVRGKRREMEGRVRRKDGWGSGGGEEEIEGWEGKRREMKRGCEGEMEGKGVKRGWRLGGEEVGDGGGCEVEGDVEGGGMKGEEGAMRRRAEGGGEGGDGGGKGRGGRW